jgi:hypothetical protein
MPQLDQLAEMMGRDGNVWAIYWCKDHTGFISEHVTTAFEGHRGHVQCIAVAIADPPRSER